MSDIYVDAPSKDSQKVLDALRAAVAKELEKKRRLGHYAVFWDGEKSVFVGEDAPQS